LYWHDLSSYLTYLNPRVDKIICNSIYVFEHVKKQLFKKNKNKTLFPQASVNLLDIDTPKDYQYFINTL
jgi:hypothetical protein